MSKRKFDDSQHSSIHDDNENDEENVAEFDDVHEDDEYPQSASEIVDDETEHRRCAKKARCDNMFLNEATTSERNERQSFITTTPNRKPCAIGNNDNTTSSLNKLKQPSNKKRVKFGAVSIYYFQRSQGFSCVPTSGGSTLGMSRKHHLNRIISLNDHLEEIRRQREINVEEQRRSNMGQQQQHEQQNHDDDVDGANAADGDHYELAADDEEDDVVVNGAEYNEGETAEYDDEFEDIAATTTMTNGNIGVNGYDGDYALTGANTVVPTTEYVYESNDIDVSAMPDDYYLQPLDSKQRRSILRAVGIQVDRDEREECQAIRLSRQSCGCNCRGQCLPETCACAIDQIKCQVDRPTFPCSCTKNSCFNPYGRVEFNAVRVRTHYLHTMMRMRIENKNQSVLPSPTHTRFDGNDGYVDQQQDDHDLYKNISAIGGAASASAIPQMRTFSTTSSRPSGNGYLTSTSMINVVDSSSSSSANNNNNNVADINNQNFWLLNGEAAIDNNQINNSSSTATTTTNNFIDLNRQSTTVTPASNYVDDGYQYQQQQKPSKMMNDEVEHYLNISRQSTLTDSSPIVNTDGVDMDDDGDDSVLKMRDRSSSFCSKSTKTSSTNGVNGSSTTYSLASLYPHQSLHYVNHNGGVGADGRSHSFNEFLDPLYFPTFAMANECVCANVNGRCQCSSDDDDEAETSSSFPSDESNSIDDGVHTLSTEKMIVMKNRNGVGDVIMDDDDEDERNNRNGTSTYLPSSPAELSAVLKKSICETVLA